MNALRPASALSRSIRTASRLMERASSGFWAHSGAPTRQASGMITSAFAASGFIRRSSRTSPRMIVKLFVVAAVEQRGLAVQEVVHDGDGAASGEQVGTRMEPM